MSTFHRLLSWLWPLRVAVLPGRSGVAEVGGHGGGASERQPHPQHP